MCALSLARLEFKSQGGCLSAARLSPLLHGADRDSRAARRAPALGPGQSPHQWEPWVPPQSLSRCSGIFRSSRNGFSSQCVKSRGQVTQSGGPGRSVGQCPSCPSLRAAYSPWVPTAPDCLVSAWSLRPPPSSVGGRVGLIGDLAGPAGESKGARYGKLSLNSEGTV